MANIAGQLYGAFGPQQGIAGTNLLYQQLLSSPAFQSLLQNYTLQGSNLGQNLTAGLARRGLTGTGVGTIAQSMGQSAGGFAQTGARGQLYQDAMQQAFQNLLARLQSYTQLRAIQMQQPSFLSSLGGGLLQGVGTLGSLGLRI